MKFPTMDEFAKDVAEKALDEYEYKGKTIRQWIEIISNTELGTNLASLGTDCISRQAAIDALGEEPLVWCDGEDEIAERNQWKRDIEAIKQLPPIQPEIVKCEECKYHHQKNCPIEKYFSLDGFCSRGKR